MKNNCNKKFSKNYKFLDNMLANDLTFIDYLERFKKLALSIFEWENLPESMDSRFLEKCLYYDGKAALLYTEEFGFINTRASDNGYINLYDYPSKINCYSYNLNKFRDTYNGINEKNKNKQAILVQNNWDRIPTCGTLELFAYRLYETQRAIDVNIKAQKTPVLLLVDEKQRLSMENLYNQYDGNRPVIYGDKQSMSGTEIKAINTQAPFIVDKLQKYKNEIFNEVLTFLGINNVSVDKKERLIAAEGEQNNELINLNLQSYLAPREYAAKQFNDLFGFTGTDKEIKVKVRSDLNNIIKQFKSTISDFNTSGGVEK